MLILIIILIIIFIYSIIMTILANYAWNFNKKKYRLLEEENDLMVYWLQKKLDGIDIEDYLNDKKISSVAFYKFNLVCEMLCAELEKYVDIKYCIDEDADNIWDGLENIPIIKPEDVKSQEKVELVIVVATKEDLELKKKVTEYLPDTQMAWAYEIIKEF